MMIEPERKPAVSSEKVLLPDDFGVLSSMAFMDRIALMTDSDRVRAGYFCEFAGRKRGRRPGKALSAFKLTAKVVEGDGGVSA